ncbi:MAG: coenzyme F420-0:L-glutamate ligase [Conexivisphaerales archaeon]
MEDSEMSDRIEVFAVQGMPHVKEGDDVGSLLVDACKKIKLELKSGDIVVIASKIVSKAEGRFVMLDSIAPGEFAINSSKVVRKDPREIEAILSASKRVVRMRKGLLLTESTVGVVGANSGADKSNIGNDGALLLLPKKPDASARKVRKTIKRLTGADVAVIISDTYGRAWREGQVDMAIGASGIKVMRDYRGKYDLYGRKLKVTLIAQADELASAAELVMGKSKGIPAAIIRGYRYEAAEDSARKLNRPDAKDLFR